IDSEFTSIERNEKEELLGLKITLKNGNQTVSSSMSNNTGLGKVSFGRKNGQLYISQDGFGSGNLAFFNMPNVQSFSFGTDSLFGQYPQNFGSFNFEEFFDDNGEAWFSNFNSESLEEFMERMRSRAGSGASGFSNQRYTFIDDPNTDKLIIIDGKESNFEELDRLSKEDKLKAVDFLQTETAISLYGEKAKDGAIIATTKD
ncbi:MAG: hypothetical protein R3213_12425, partial [Flavobacteriaceae bacterium]|nr:hypothetical protein [Flavobacteriaceae bacterium]